MKKLLVLAAAGIGYVLGSRAGRGRYEQLKRTADKLRNDPRVQQKAHQAADLVKEQAPVVKDKVAHAASAAAGKVKEQAGGSHSHDVGDQLNPDSTHFQDNPFPQGDLP